MPLVADLSEWGSYKDTRESFHDLDGSFTMRHSNEKSEDTVPEVTGMPSVESMVALERTQLESKVTLEERQGMSLIKQDEGTDYASNILNLDCNKNRSTLCVSLT